MSFDRDCNTCDNHIQGCINMPAECRQCLTITGETFGVATHLPFWIKKKETELTTAVEKDPNGISAHAPGAKLDAGKVRPSLILDGFARALLAVAEVGTFGANKYTENGWQEVQDGVKRYTNAKDRHRLQGAYEKYDPQSKLMHRAHEAWNALAALELELREQQSQ